MGFKKVADGTFSENFSKEGSQPDFIGKVIWEGVRYNLAVWRRENSDTGEPFYSFAVSKPEGPAQEPRPRKPLTYKPPQAPSPKRQPDDDLEDDIPF